MRLTSRLLKRIIREEAAKFGDAVSTEDRAKDTDEVDADEYASSLEKQLDFMKALKIEENRLRRRLHKVTETRRRLARRI